MLRLDTTRERHALRHERKRVLHIGTDRVGPPLGRLKQQDADRGNIVARRHSIGADQQVMTVHLDVIFAAQGKSPAILREGGGYIMGRLIKVSFPLHIRIGGKHAVPTSENIPTRDISLQQLIEREALVRVDVALQCDGGVGHPFRIEPEARLQEIRVGKRLGPIGLVGPLRLEIFHVGPVVNVLADLPAIPHRDGYGIFRSGGGRRQ